MYLKQKHINYALVSLYLLLNNAIIEFLFLTEFTSLKYLLQTYLEQN